MNFTQMFKNGKKEREENKEGKRKTEWKNCEVRRKDRMAKKISMESNGIVNISNCPS